MRAPLRTRRWSGPVLALAVVLTAAACTSSAARPHSPHEVTPSPKAPHSAGASAAAQVHYPSVASVLRTRATGGLVLERNIPSSGAFRPRPAFLYVPPVLRGSAHRHVPVLELLHGTPGQPSDWLTRGALRATADAFAARHGGRAPLIVAPDLNGTQRGDSECIRTASGAPVEKYLTVDVVRWVRHKYRLDVGKSRWWVAGLSEGGLCSAVLALRHPSLYAAFGDMSGLLRPIVEHLTQAESDRVLYRGDAVAQREHDPTWLLQHRRYSGLRAWFACGASDGKVLPAQKALVAAARRAGLPTYAEVRPGRHAWSVWTVALRQLLPWLWSRQPT